MRSFFNYENGVMNTINKVADSVTLGVLWVLFSLPVFTMGASSAAFYYAYNRCIRQKMGYAWKTFLESFKSNFKQSTQIWLIILAFSLIAVLDCYLLALMKNAGFWVRIIQAAIMIVMLAGLIWTLYLFPYLSRFDLPNKAVMKNCALIMLANMPQSILLLVVYTVCVAGFIYLPLLNLFIPSLYMLCASRIQEKIFRKYMRPEDLEKETTALSE